MDDDMDYEFESKPRCAARNGRGWSEVENEVVTDAGTKWQRTATEFVQITCDRCNGSGLEPWE